MSQRVLSFLLAAIRIKSSWKYVSLCTHAINRESLAVHEHRCNALYSCSRVYRCACKNTNFFIFLESRKKLEFFHAHLYIREQLYRALHVCSWTARDYRLIACVHIDTYYQLFLVRITASKKLRMRCGISWIYFFWSKYTSFNSQKPTN